jgi:hypothetical protein
MRSLGISDGPPLEQKHLLQDAVPDATEVIRIQLDFLGGTLAPFLRASERPMAIACFRLLTVPPLPPFPDFKVPRFLRRSALPTDLAAAFPYLGILSPFSPRSSKDEIHLGERPVGRQADARLSSRFNRPRHESRPQVFGERSFLKNNSSDPALSAPALKQLDAKAVLNALPGMM